MGGSETTASPPLTGSPARPEPQTERDRTGSPLFLPSDSLQHQSSTLIKGPSPSSGVHYLVQDGVIPPTTSSDPEGRADTYHRASCFISQNRNKKVIPPGKQETSKESRQLCAFKSTIVASEKPQGSRAKPNPSKRAREGTAAARQT
ncbi:hypothetical protein MG293_011247 [Ovis ammon polii]|uniref:Uncharacterized protein n=1 Tax=Ovis ammon polii TaxID=230172 RepID=A0AAD4U7J0_OVIAM|nr:hypothetical protein MG293_011247 [Ovis ammon polii]